MPLSKKKRPISLRESAPVFVAIAVLFALLLGACGPIPTAPTACRYGYVTIDTFYVEPGHWYGGTVSTPHCLKQ